MPHSNSQRRRKRKKEKKKIWMYLLNLEQEYKLFSSLRWWFILKPAVHMADSPLLQLNGHWEQTPSFPMHPSRFWLKRTPPCLVPALSFPCRRQIRAVARRILYPGKGGLQGEAAEQARGERPTKSHLRTIFIQCSWNFLPWALEILGDLGCTQTVISL